MCWALNTVGAAVLSGLPSYLTVVPLPPQDKGTITNPADVVGKVLANQLCKERGCGSLPERLPFDKPALSNTNFPHRKGNSFSKRKEGNI